MSNPSFPFAYFLHPQAILTLHPCSHNNYIRIDVEYTARSRHVEHTWEKVGPSLLDDAFDGNLDRLLLARDFSTSLCWSLLMRYCSAEEDHLFRVATNSNYDL